MSIQSSRSLITFVEKRESIQIIIERDNTIITLMEFYEIDDAMPFVMFLGESFSEVTNPHYLKQLLRSESKFDWVYYHKNPLRIQRKKTAYNIVMKGYSVEFAAKMVGLERQTIHEHMSKNNVE